MRLVSMINISVFSILVMGLPLSQAKTFIYPMEGKKTKKQEMDEFACYKWAKEKTGFDPNQPAPTQHTATRSSSRHRGGGILGGAMGGAALGAIGGAIAGDAGKGAAIGAGVGAAGGLMKQNRQHSEAAHVSEQTQVNEQQNRQTFNRAYGVCLEGRGYKVG
ncbi:MAG: hypothetical protein KC592_18150 [Nitrospira sp.]|nr:hypothetical protein [Nitrospira sp.]